jgi:GNAT superfamily N-acetyltransferase
MGDYIFKIVLFNEVKNLKKKHPIVYKTFLNKKGEFNRFHHLIKDPDIYENFPVFFYLEHDQELVSYTFSLPDILFIGDQQYQWSWGGGLFSDPAYRGKGLATKLIDNMVNYLHSKNIGRGGVFSTPAAIHIYEKLGYTVLGYANRFVFLKSCKPILKKYLKIEVFSEFCDSFFRPISKLILYLHRDKEIEREEEFELTHITNLDRFTNIGGHNLFYFSKFHFNDSFPKLIFKIMRNSNLKLFIVVDKLHQQPLLYFVINNRYIHNPLGGFSGFKLMTLMDFGFNKEKPICFKILTSKVFDLFSESDAEVLDIISSYEEFSQILKNKWMVKVGKGMSFKYTVPSSWELSDDAKSIESWHLTHFSSDAYSFE